MHKLFEKSQVFVIICLNSLMYVMICKFKQYLRVYEYNTSCLNNSFINIIFSKKLGGNIRHVLWLGTFFNQIKEKFLNFNQIYLKTKCCNKARYMLLVVTVFKVLF